MSQCPLTTKPASGQWLELLFSSHKVHGLPHLWSCSPGNRQLKPSWILSLFCLCGIFRFEKYQSPTAVIRRYQSSFCSSHIFTKKARWTVLAELCVVNCSPVRFDRLSARVRQILLVCVVQLREEWWITVNGITLRWAFWPSRAGDVCLTWRLLNV